MPARKALAADINGIVSCINDMYDYLKTRNVLDARNVVTRADVLLWQNNGYQAYVWAAPGGRVDAVCIYRLEQRKAPDSNVLQPWMSVPYLVVRPSVIPLTADRKKYLMRALGPAIIDAAEGMGAVGVVCDYPTAWTDLTDFLSQWQALSMHETVYDQTRFWARVNPGLPLIRAAIADAGG